MADRHSSDNYVMTLRIQPNNGRLLEALSKRLGVPKTSVVVLGLHALAKEHGVPILSEEAEAEHGSR